MNGTVVLSGANSRLDVLGTGQNIIGNFGLTGMFSVTSGATANYGVSGTLVVAGLSHSCAGDGVDP